MMRRTRRLARTLRPQRLTEHEKRLTQKALRDFDQIAHQRKQKEKER
jgi:hypothetical protein